MQPAIMTYEKVPQKQRTNIKIKRHGKEIYLQNSFKTEDWQTHSRGYFLIPVPREFV